LYVGLKRKDESNKFDIFPKKYIRLDIATYVSLSIITISKSTHKDN